MVAHVIAYSDTDAGGVMHHARYIELAERGYHQWFKQRGMSFRTLHREHGLSLAVYDISARYKSPIFLEDEIDIVTTLESIDRRGLVWRTCLIRNGAVAFSMSTTMVCIQSVTKSIVSVPDFLISKLAGEVKDKRRFRRN
jgi:acyl-CoA thioester hydrolase